MNFVTQDKFCPAYDDLSQMQFTYLSIFNNLFTMDRKPIDLLQVSTQGLVD